MTADSRMREILAECLTGMFTEQAREMALGMLQDGNSGYHVAEAALEAMRRVRAETIEAAAKAMDEYANGNHDDRNRAAVIRALSQPKDETLEAGSYAK